MPSRSLLVVIACAAFIASACTSSTSGRPQVAAPSASPVISVPTILILDGSGSMAEADVPGPRIEAAKAAARGLVDALPDDAIIGLETYGTTVGSAPGDKPAGCNDVTTLLVAGTLDRAAMRSAIDGIVPSGYTPISLALQRAVDQLPAGGESQAVVLVSDGEDTCDTPPCDTAAKLKQAHPGLSISTVGFKVDGQAADQLRCIADATGGLFVEASNAAQLASRLLATQNAVQAGKSLSDRGFDDVDLGMGIDDIRSRHSDFPAADRTGSVKVVWRDCDFGFVDGVLDAISPHDGGRTIDGVGVGTPAARAGELYGPPLGAGGADGNGVFEVIFDANPGGAAAYRMGITDYSNDGGKLSGTVKTVVLCRCKPKAGASGQGAEPERVVLKPVDSQGNTKAGYLKDESQRYSSIDCSDGSRSPYDVGDGVRRCGANADEGDACWPTANGAFVLCLQDPFKNVLMLRPADGATVPLVAKDGPPHPMGLLLEDGTQCRVRLGGAWSQQQPTGFEGAYFCHGGTVQADFLAAWAGAGTDDGITKGANGWTVEVGGDTGPLTSLKVVKTYYVGVA